MFNAKLPAIDAERKAIPLFDGAVMYFPNALAAVAEVSRIGNEQHNPGQPLHWARGKSMDQFNTALRHLVDHRMGVRYDNDGGRHLAKAAWRILAALQLDIEAEYEAMHPIKSEVQSRKHAVRSSVVERAPLARTPKSVGRKPRRHP